MHTEHHNPGMIPMLAGAMGAPLTMSSREIAELVKSRHDKVKQSIDRLVERGVIVQPPMGDEQDTDAMGRKRTTSVYHLEKRDSFIVVAQLSPEFTARLVDRWQELEEEKANGSLLPNFGDPAQAARAWADQVEAKQALILENREKDAVIAKIQPKADEYDAWLDTEGVVKVEDFCNKHQVKRNHPGYVLRKRQYLHQKKMLATLVGTRSGIVKNIVSRENFEYVDSKGNAVEAQSAMIVKQREGDLLRMLIDDHGAMAFRNDLAFARAKRMIGLEGAA